MSILKLKMGTITIVVMKMNDKEKVVAKLEGKVICPKCKKEIDYLEGYREKRFNLEILRGVLVEGKDRLVMDSFRAECPECLDLVADDYDKAEKILRGK